MVDAREGGGGEAGREVGGNGGIDIWPQVFGVADVLEHRALRR